MNLNGESSKNKKTILNGKPLYGYDQAKKKNYFRHTYMISDIFPYTICQFYIFLLLRTV